MKERADEEEREKESTEASGLWCTICCCVSVSGSFLIIASHGMASSDCVCNSQSATAQKSEANHRSGSDNLKDGGRFVMDYINSLLWAHALYMNLPTSKASILYWR